MVIRTNLLSIRYLPFSLIVIHFPDLNVCLLEYRKFTIDILISVSLTLYSGYFKDLLIFYHCHLTFVRRARLQDASLVSTLVSGRRMPSSSLKYSKFVSYSSLTWIQKKKIIFILQGLSNPCSKCCSYNSQSNYVQRELTKILYPFNGQFAKRKYEHNSKVPWIIAF